VPLLNPLGITLTDRPFLGLTLALTRPPPVGLTCDRVLRWSQEFRLSSLSRIVHLALTCSSLWACSCLHLPWRGWHHGHKNLSCVITCMKNTLAILFRHFTNTNLFSLLSNALSSTPQSHSFDPTLHPVRCYRYLARLLFTLTNLRAETRPKDTTDSILLL